MYLKKMKRFLIAKPSTSKTRENTENVEEVTPDEASPDEAAPDEAPPRKKNKQIYNFNEK